MTHYMELLATNQPWNLIVYMAVPVILAETIAVTELFILLKRDMNSWVRTLNSYASILVGAYFACVFAYLMYTAVLPITTAGAWRGIGDIVAVGSYLLGVVPLGGLALLELGIIGKKRDTEGKLALHATFVAIFLVVAHIAMIAGMISPSVFGYTEMAMTHTM